VNAQQKGDTFDMHWTPITNFCTPCQVDFDIIMKFETLQVNILILLPICRTLSAAEMNKPDNMTHRKCIANNSVFVISLKCCEEKYFV
jgi:hypothetical protein